MYIYFLFILHIKIHLTIILIKKIYIFKFDFLKNTIKSDFLKLIFFLNITVKTMKPKRE
jgi:hypothetical protein